MSTGLSSTYAHAILNIRRATTYTAFSPYLKLHTADPGASATTAASAEATRKALTYAAPSAGSMAASAVSWTSWSAGTETISHVSEWDASTAGNFIESGALSASKTVANGDTLTVTVTSTQGTLAA